MEKTKIVNIKSGQKYDIYIGRANKYYNQPVNSIFANPKVIGKDGTREEVIEQFKKYAPTNKILMDSLYLIDDKILGCWCDYPEEDCHGRILIELREQQKNMENKKYRIGVVGSRDYNNKEEIFKYLDSKIDKIECIVSGGCPNGADFYGHLFAKERGLSITIHYPNWNRDGKGAGFIRNKRIVQDSDIIVAFTTGSKGTQNTIDWCKKLNKKLIVHNVKPDEKDVDKVTPLNSEE